MCKDENIARTVDYDDTDGHDYGSGNSGCKPADDIGDRINEQPGRSQDRPRQLPPSVPPQYALVNQGRASFDEARYLATMLYYLKNLSAAPAGAVFT